MRLVLSGGGTGGHVYPALEVGRLAQENGAELRYFGSEIGMERSAAERAGVDYVGYPAGPINRSFRLSTVNSVLGLVRSIQIARNALIGKTDVVFATGGYGAAPTMFAARSLRIPYVVHDSNSVPGRSNRMFAKQAAAFTVAFRKPLDFPELGATRTGQPIRDELRAATATRTPAKLILVLGGSQGSVYLNQLAVKTASQVSKDIQFLIAAGRKNAEALIAAGASSNVKIVPFLDSDDLCRAYQSATLVLGRSGGTLAELAMFGLPSILLPLPSSADDHQLVNAQEFLAMQAATVLWPADAPSRPGLTEATPANAAQAIEEWMNDPTRISNASHNLKEWDIPDATQRIWAHLTSAVR